jgi:uncharacterized membrane protein
MLHIEQGRIGAGGEYMFPGGRRIGSVLSIRTFAGFSLALATLLLLMLAPDDSARAQPAPNDGMTALAFCNAAGEDIFVALVAAAAPGGLWTRRGWAAIPDAQCRSVGRYAQGVFYYYIKYASGLSISGDTGFCAQDGPFNLLNTAAACGQNEQILKFTKASVAGPAWSMTFYGASPAETTLPTGTGPSADSQFMYDSCSRVWNSDNWKAKSDSRAMEGAIKHNQNGTYSSNCYRTFNSPDQFTAIKLVRDACLKDGWTCYDFSRGSSLVPWAWKEYQALKSGQRR